MNLGFSVEVSSKAVKDLRNLSVTNQRIFISIAKRIDLLAKNPYLGKSLKGNLKNCFSLRIGEYRVIYEIYPKQKVILIIRVGHRKDIYR